MTAINKHDWLMLIIALSVIAAGVFGWIGVNG